MMKHPGPAFITSRPEGTKENGVGTWEGCSYRKSCWTGMQLLFNHSLVGGAKGINNLTSFSFSF
jgi:hypothetical protein